MCPAPVFPPRSVFPPAISVSLPDKLRRPIWSEACKAALRRTLQTPYSLRRTPYATVLGKAYALSLEGALTPRRRLNDALRTP